MENRLFRDGIDSGGIAEGRFAGMFLVTWYAYALAQTLHVRAERVLRLEEEERSPGGMWHEMAGWQMQIYSKLERALGSIHILLLLLLLPTRPSDFSRPPAPSSPPSLIFAGEGARATKNGQLYGRKFDGFGPDSFRRTGSVGILLVAPLSATPPFSFSANAESRIENRTKLSPRNIARAMREHRREREREMQNASSRDDEVSRGYGAP